MMYCDSQVGTNYCLERTQSASNQESRQLIHCNILEVGMPFTLAPGSPDSPHQRTTWLRLQPLGAHNRVRPEKIWPTFCRQHYQIYFLEWKLYFCVCVFQLSLKFVPEGPIDNKSALVKVTAWRLADDKPLSDAMMTGVLLCHTPVWHYKAANCNESIQHRSVITTLIKHMLVKEIKYIFFIYDVPAWHVDEMKSIIPICQGRRFYQEWNSLAKVHDLVVLTLLMLEAVYSGLFGQCL